MVVHRSTALISYSDTNAATSQRDYLIANRLKNDLEKNGIHTKVTGYSNSFQDTDTYQWLIFIHSPEMKNSSMARTIDDALDRVVKRRMRGVIAVTASLADLPDEWATIRKYDASDPLETNAALTGILRAMQYPKIPFAEAAAQEQRQQAQRVAASAVNRLRRTSKGVPVTIGLIALLMVVVVIGAFRYLTPTFNSSSDDVHSGPAATAQAKLAATQTALASTPQASPTVDTKTLQQEYEAITRQTPTIVGFGTNEKWHLSKDQTSCAFDASNPAAYHARISTMGKYKPCSASNTSFTNFALQVTMSIVGDAGGVFFRSQNGTYYRVAFNQSDQSTSDMDMLSLYLCQQDCSTLEVNDGTLLWSNQVPVNPGNSITLTIIAQDNTIDLYYNTTPEAHVNDTTQPHVLSGQIGVYAASLENPTDVTFSGLKVWSLDKKQ